MRDAHALGLPSRARRVNQVGDRGRIVIAEVSARAVARHTFQQRVQRHLRTRLRTVGCRFGDHEPDVGVLQDEIASRGRVAGVQRNVRAAGRHHAEQRAQQIDATLHAHRHALARPDAACANRACDPRRALQQFAIAQPLRRRFDSNRVRRTCGGRTDQRADRQIGNLRHRAAQRFAPCGERMRRPQRQLADRRGRRVRQRRCRAKPARQHARDRRGFVAILVVLALERQRVRAADQHEIELAVDEQRVRVVQRRLGQRRLGEIGGQADERHRHRSRRALGVVRRALVERATGRAQQHVGRRVRRDVERQARARRFALCVGVRDQVERHAALVSVAGERHAERREPERRLRVAAVPRARAGRLRRRGGHGHVVSHPAVARRDWRGIVPRQVERYGRVRRGRRRVCVHGRVVVVFKPSTLPGNSRSPARRGALRGTSRPLRPPCERSAGHAR